jgi:hypothetical protein
MTTSLKIASMAANLSALFFQDRIKEWGKRYLIPAAEWCGIEIPDRVVKVLKSP